MKKKMLAALCAALMLGAVPFVPMQTAIPARAEDTEDAAVLTDGDYTYTLDDTGRATLTGYTGTETALDLPAALGGHPVTTIGERAFYENERLTAVTIPEGVTTIGKSAFSECHELLSAHLPDGLMTIGEDAFGQCYSMTSVNFPDSVWYIEKNAFFNCFGLTTVDIPENVVRIGDTAFAWCGHVTSVTVPPSVRSLGGGAFYECERLTSVTLSEGLETIGLQAFRGCVSLTSLTIPKSVSFIYGPYAFEPSITVCVYPGSYGHAYAAEHCARYLVIGENVLGDVDSDGDVDANDASDVLVAATEMAVGHAIALTDAQQTAADVNKDEQFDAVDASYILVYSTLRGVGREASFEALTAADA